MTYWTPLRNLRDGLKYLVDAGRESHPEVRNSLINTAEDLCHDGGLDITMALEFMKFPNIPYAKFKVERAIKNLEQEGTE